MFTGHCAPVDAFYEWNPNKADANAVRHWIGFDHVSRVDWQRAWEWRDVRLPYAEVRTIALVPMGDTMFTLVYTRRGNRIRVISLRPASKREFRIYVSNQNS